MQPQASLARSVSERHLQRSASPGAGAAFDLAAPDVWRSHPSVGAANGVQHVHREQGPTAAAEPAQQQHVGSRPAEETVSALQLDQMAPPEPADDNSRRRAPAGAAAGPGGNATAAVGRTLEVRIVPATKGVRPLCTSM